MPAGLCGLADFLFVAARWACYHEEGKEFVYGNDTNKDGTRSVHVQESGDLKNRPASFCWGIAGLVWSVVSTMGLILFVLRMYDDYGFIAITKTQEL